MHTVIIAKQSDFSLFVSLLDEPFYYNTLNYSNQFVDSPRENIESEKKCDEVLKYLNFCAHTVLRIVLIYFSKLYACHYTENLACANLLVFF